MKRLKEDCAAWSDEYLAGQFALGPKGFMSSEAWGIVRSEALGRELVTESMAAAIEAPDDGVSASLGSGNGHVKGEDPFMFPMRLAFGGGLAVVGAMILSSGYTIVSVFIIGCGIGTIRGALLERVRQRERAELDWLLDDSQDAERSAP